MATDQQRIVGNSLASPSRSQVLAMLLIAGTMLAAACSSGAGDGSVPVGASTTSLTTPLDWKPVYEPLTLPVADDPGWISQADALECRGSPSWNPGGFLGISVHLNAESFLGWVTYAPEKLMDPQDLERETTAGVVFSSTVLSGGEVRNGAETLSELRVRVDPDLLTVAATESSLGATVHLLISNQNVFMAASERPDGTWTAISPCRDGQFKLYLEPWMEEIGASDYGAVAKLLYDDPTLFADYQDFAIGRDWYGTPWPEVDPDERYVVDAPADVLSGLERVTIRLELPEGWQDLDGGLCTKNSIGWNTCIELDNENVVSDDGYIYLSATVVPGEDLSIQLIGPRGSDVRLGELGVVPYTAFDGAAEPRVSATAAPRSVSSLDALAEAAEERPILEVVTE